MLYWDASNNFHNHSSKMRHSFNPKVLGPVVQSLISLTSLLVVKMLTVLVSIISNSQLVLLKKNVSSFCKCKSYSHFFSKNICIYAIFNDQRFNDTLTNGIVSFEQLGLDIFLFLHEIYVVVLIWNTSPRHFKWVPTTRFCREIRKNGEVLLMSNTTHFCVEIRK